MKQQVKFKDTMGEINIHGKFSTNDFEESHLLAAGPFEQDFKFWLFMEILDMPSLCGRDNDGHPRWCVEVTAVAPGIVQAKEVMSAKQSCGWEGMDMDDDFHVAMMLQSYGTHAHISSESNNNLRQAIKTAVVVARDAAQDIGQYLDKPMNKLGTTALEAMSGDLLAPLRRPATNPESALVQKMYGINTLADIAAGSTVNTLGGQVDIPPAIVQIGQALFFDCPNTICALEHWRTDKTCRCNDKTHTEMESWGYVWSGLFGRWVAGEEVCGQTCTEDEATDSKASDPIFPNNEDYGCGDPSCTHCGDEA